MSSDISNFTGATVKHKKCLIVTARVCSKGIPRALGSSSRRAGPSRTPLAMPVPLLLHNGGLYVLDSVKDRQGGICFGAMQRVLIERTLDAYIKGNAATTATVKRAVRSSACVC